MINGGGSTLRTCGDDNVIDDNFLYNFFNFFYCRVVTVFVECHSQYIFPRLSGIFTASIVRDRLNNGWL